jgi:nucleotide-binding universal stress UspA family protein
VKILVCTDGERHSTGAIQRAISLGLSLPARVTALHVIDPYLKKFYNELYSQGRRRYLEYVEECLQAEADRIRREFTGLSLAEGLQADFRIRYGEPLREILEELRRTAPDLLVTGGKPLNAWGRFRSRNLPLSLQRKANTPVSVILTGSFTAAGQGRKFGRAASAV